MPEKEITEPQIFRVQSFVARGCAGNPAGVCLLPQKQDEKHYKKVAIAMDLPETAFVVKENDIYKLRWFTRNGSEVDLCGHATLAASHILWSKGYLAASQPIYYDTKSGILSAKRAGDYITLDFPLDEVTELKDKRSDLAALLGLKLLYTGKTKFDYLVVVDTEETVKNLVPDFEKLKQLGERGVIVTAKAVGKQYDFVSRFFAPAIGIDEDPVTGSAHCALGLYWSAILKKQEMTGYQASREGGMVKVTVLPDRVWVGGQAREVKISDDLKREIYRVLKSGKE